MGKLYIAYGSNLNVEQMGFRCPAAKLAGTSFLKDWELIYRGSMTGAYATIRRRKGKYVPVGIWEIKSADEAALDRYEGYPTFYQKKTLSFILDGKKQSGLVYIMRPDALPGIPSERYVNTVYQGYMDLNLDCRYLYESLKLAITECRRKERG